MIRLPPRSTRTYTLFPYTTLFRSGLRIWHWIRRLAAQLTHRFDRHADAVDEAFGEIATGGVDRQFSAWRDQVLEAHELGNVLVRAKAMIDQRRTEERRVGKKCCMTGNYGWSAEP